MFQYSEMQEADIPEVSALLMRVFRDQIAPDFPALSRAGIRQYMSEQALYARHNFHHFALVCRSRRREMRPVDLPPWREIQAAEGADDMGGTQSVFPILGVIEVREHRHISLLFVDVKHQRRGIARQLVTLAIARCRKHRRDLHTITVRAAPAAVPAYIRLGFNRDPARDEADSPAVAMQLALDSVPMVG